MASLQFPDQFHSLRVVRSDYRLSTCMKHRAKRIVPIAILNAPGKAELQAILDRSDGASPPSFRPQPASQLTASPEAMPDSSYDTGESFPLLHGLFE